MSVVDLAAAGVETAGFTGPAGTERFLVVSPDPGLGFVDQLAQIGTRYRAALGVLGLPPETAVFRRLFVSDVQNQIAQVEAGDWAGNTAEGPVALSIVEQPPAGGAKAVLLAYHLAGPAGLIKHRLSRRHLMVSKGAVRHLWSSRLCVGHSASGLSPAEQTRAVFSELATALASEGAGLADHCLRTWIYVKDLDANYGAVVEGRSIVFSDAGLHARSHYIASTGIEGACPHLSDTVTLDAYSVLDLAPGQVTHLNALDHLCLTRDYGVTFERATRVAWSDRAHILVSGTASIDRFGQVVHPGDVLAQLDRALSNVEALLAAGGARLTDLTYLIVYLRDASDYPAARRRLSRLLGDLPMVIVRARVCRPAWLIEVEGLAIAPYADPTLPDF